MLGKIDESTIIIGDFSTTLSDIDRSIREKIKRDRFELNIAISQLDIMSMHSLFYPTA